MSNWKEKIGELTSSEKVETTVNFDEPNSILAELLSDESPVGAGRRYFEINEVPVEVSYQQIDKLIKSYIPEADIEWIRMTPQETGIRPDSKTTLDVLCRIFSTRARVDGDGRVRLENPVSEIPLVVVPDKLLIRSNSRKTTIGEEMIPEITLKGLKESAAFIFTQYGEVARHDLSDKTVKIYVNLIATVIKALGLTKKTLDGWNIKIDTIKGQEKFLVTLIRK
jgi:hypothetical protein